MTSEKKPAGAKLRSTVNMKALIGDLDKDIETAVLAMIAVKDADGNAQKEPIAEATLVKALENSKRSSRASVQRAESLFGVDFVETEHTKFESVVTKSANIARSWLSIEAGTPLEGDLIFLRTKNAVVNMIQGLTSKQMFKHDISTIEALCEAAPDNELSREILRVLKNTKIVLQVSALTEIATMLSIGFDKELVSNLGRDFFEKGE